MIGPGPLPLILILTTIAPFWAGLSISNTLLFESSPRVGEWRLLFLLSGDPEAGWAQIWDLAIPDNGEGVSADRR